MKSRKRNQLLLQYFCPIHLMNINADLLFLQFLPTQIEHISVSILSISFRINNSQY